MKLLLPENVAEVTVDGQTYRPDDDGVVEVGATSHIPAVQSHGAIPVDGMSRADIRALRSGEVSLAGPERVSSEFDATIAAKDAEIAALKQTQATDPALLQAKDDEIADLKRQLAEAQAARGAPEAEEAQQGGEGTLTPPAGAPATGDISPAPGGGGVIVPGSHTTSAEPQGDAGDNLDKDAEKLEQLLANKPDTENYNAMLVWLREAGVSVPGNISKVKAREIVEETVKELEAGRAAAAEERAKHKDESLPADTTTTTA